MSSVKTFLAFLLTLLLVAIAPRLHEDTAEVSYFIDKASGFVIDHNSIGRFSGRDDPIVEAWVLVPTDTIPISLSLFYRPRDTETFASVPMQLKPTTLDRYFAKVPRLGRMESYEYHIELQSADSSVSLRLPKEPEREIVMLFEGRPPLILWAAHVFFMFLAAMYGFLGLFHAFGLKADQGLKRLSRRVFTATMLLLLGTIFAGSLISHSRFGYYWGGWPFGANLSQTYLELLILYWMALTVLLRGTIFSFKPEKNLIKVPTAIVLTLIGVLFMIGVYLAGGHFVEIPL